MLELILALVLVQQPKIVTCTIIEPYRSVSCNGETWTFNGQIEEWQWVAPLQNGTVNPDAPLTLRKLEKGDSVKAKFIEGRLIPVEDCKVRVWQNKRTWLANGRREERMPLGLDTEPDDCQPWYNKQN